MRPGYGRTGAGRRPKGTVVIPGGPVITTLTPIDGAVDIPVTRLVKVTWDRALDPASVSTSTCELRTGGNLVSRSVSWDSTANRITITPTLDLLPGATYQVTIKGGASGIKAADGVQFAADQVTTFTTAGSTGGGGGSVIVGYASLYPNGTGSGVTGGDGGTVLTFANWAEWKAKVNTPGPRILKPVGTAVIDGGGEIVKITQPNYTIDGTGWHGSWKRAGTQLKAGNGKLIELRLRPGDQVNSPADTDGLTLNAGGTTADTLAGIWIDHCSISWGPDVTLAVLMRVFDLTVSHCIIGPGLQYSAHPEASGGNNRHNMGQNTTVINSLLPETNLHGQRHTFYRNYLPHNWQRNIKIEQVDLTEWLNNVVYNWGNQAGHGNPRAGNVIGNFFQKGPDTAGGTLCFEKDTSYNEYANALYFAGNIGRNADGSSFTPTHNATETRGTPWAMSGLTAATMDAALAATVVAEAGPTFVDSIDQILKDNFTNRDGSWWNGVGKGAPEPSWPAF